MSYFSDFPLTYYSFGNNEEEVLVQNIATYVEILDDVKINAAFYQDYYVQGGERPDQISFILYQNPHMHWTFYLMNDKIREQGWPMQNHEVIDKAKKDYPNFTIITQDPIFNTFSVGDIVEGDTSGARGTIVHKDLTLGQIVVELEDRSTVFQTAEDVTCEGETIVSSGAVYEYLAPHHYEVDGEHVDLELDNNMNVPMNAVPVTRLDFYMNENSSLKQIRVIKPSSINAVQQLFNEALRS